MDLKLKKQFRGETNLDVFVWDENNNVAYTEAYVNWIEKQLIIPVVMQSLPKRLSNAAYLNAREMRYEDFVTWWDEQV